MTDTFKISRLKEQEIDELVGLVNSAYRGDSSRKGWTTEADLLDGIRTDPVAIRSLVEMPGSVILAGKDELDHIVGCVYLHQEKADLFLGMLTVAPELQAQGLGKKLLAAAEEYAITVSAENLVITVIDSRFELIAWYNRHGYAPTGETRPFPSDPAFGIPKQPLQFIVMKKRLG